MKIIGVLTFKIVNSVVTLQDSDFDLGFVGYFARSSTRELLTFFTTEIIKQNYQKNNTKMLKIVNHEQSNSDLCLIILENECVCIICDTEYPKRVVFNLIDSVINKKNSLRYILEECQDPLKIDQIMRIQKNVDDTKLILYDTIEKALDKGEKLDMLVEKSNELSDTSKDFYKYSKKLNSCCSVA